MVVLMISAETERLVFTQAEERAPVSLPLALLKSGTWVFISCPAGAENGAESGLLLSWIFQASVLLSGNAFPT